jgi:hypothetical protein
MTYLYPPLAYHLFPFIAAASALAEIPLQLWLIVMSVNDQRLKEQASASLIAARLNTPDINKLNV